MLCIGRFDSCIGDNMLSFCAWKDEDGRHYGVTNRNPKAFFNWPGCHLCDPKYAQIMSSDLDNLFITRDDMNRLLDGEFVEIDLEDDAWDWYFDIRLKMKFVY